MLLHFCNLLFNLHTRPHILFHAENCQSTVENNHFMWPFNKETILYVLHYLLNVKKWSSVSPLCLYSIHATNDDRGRKKVSWTKEVTVFIGDVTVQLLQDWVVKVCMHKCCKWLCVVMFVFCILSAKFFTLRSTMTLWLCRSWENHTSISSDKPTPSYSTLTLAWRCSLLSLYGWHVIGHTISFVTLMHHLVHL